MRNILVFPDGSEQDFQYPSNRDLEVGEKLQVQLKDEIIHVMQITQIIRKEKAIHYHLSLS